MGPAEWVAVLGILVGALTVGLSGLTAFLFNLALKVRSLEVRLAAYIEGARRTEKRLDRFEDGVRQLNEYLRARGWGLRKTKEPPDSDEAETGEGVGKEEW